MTSWLRSPNGTMTLRPMQAQVLSDLHDYGGAIAAAKISSGKTLVTALAPTVLGAKRPLLLVPAALVDKTKREFVKLSEHWKVCREYNVFSYDKLSLAKYADYLDRLQPDLIVADECHRLKHLRKSARAKRIARYMKEHPETHFVALTGTLSRKSLREYGHISDWALKALSPLPRIWHELEQWSDALDHKVNDRLAPGVLMELDDEKKTDIEHVRASFYRRKAQTPGFVTYHDTEVSCSITLSAIKFDDYDPSTEQKFRNLRDSYTTPDGIAFAEPVLLWQYLREMSLGFWYRCDPPPPVEWRECRKAWGSFVRDVLSGNRQRLDTELQVALACSRGELLSHGLYEQWKAIRPTFTPNQTTVMYDESPLRRVADWLENEKGLVWTPFRAAGVKLAEMTGFPYFGQQGVDAKVGSIEGYKGGPAILSIAANCTGRNLQDRWSRNLVLGGSSSGVEWEQLIGRTHRDGQEADCVSVEVLLGCLENYDGISNALKEAEQDRSSNGNASHKLLIADNILPTQQEVDTWRSARWEK